MKNCINNLKYRFILFCTILHLNVSSMYTYNYGHVIGMVFFILEYIDFNVEIILIKYTCK